MPNPQKTLGRVMDTLQLNPDERAAAVANGVIRAFIAHPEVYGWRDPVAEEALRLARLAILAADKQ